MGTATALLLTVSAVTAIGYLLGTVPSADLVARLATRGRVDLRATDDGNPGATNAIKTLGMRWGLVVLAADVSKGAVAAAVGAGLDGARGSALAGTAAVVGHVVPVWTRGRGGKGVATSAGFCLLAFPVYFPLDLGVAVGSTMLRRSDESAIRVASCIWVAATVLWWQAGWWNLWGPRPDGWLVGGAVVTSLVIQAAFARARRARRASIPA